MTVAWIDFEPAPGTSTITDAFGGSALSLTGRVTDTGNKTWTVSDGSNMGTDGTGSYVANTGIPAVGHGQAWLDAGFSNGTIHVDVSPIGESNNPAFRTGLIFRYAGVDDYWVFFNYRSPAGALGYYFRSYVAGVLTYDSGLLTTGARDTGAAIPLDVIMSGTSLKGYYDGVLRVDITNTAHQTATKCGVCSYGYGGTYFSATP